MEEKSMLQSIALIYKQQNNDAFTFAQGVGKWLSDRGVSLFMAEHMPKKKLRLSSRTIKAIDLVLVCGGDGTIVSVARQMLGTGKPLAGVNFGKVGFLAELDSTSWVEGLEKVLAGDIDVEKRMSLTAQVERHGKIIFEQEVINDIALTRGKVARLVTLELFINNKFFTSLRSDGLVISTPTGSTGYACSAGGPIVHQVLSSYVVTAICPFLGNFPPLVQDAGTEMSIVIKNATLDTYLTFDGHLGFSLNQGDILHVHGNKERAYFAELGIVPYYERLARAGFVSATRASLS